MRGVALVLFKGCQDNNLNFHKRAPEIEVVTRKNGPNSGPILLSLLPDQLYIFKPLLHIHSFLGASLYISSQYERH